MFHTNDHSHKHTVLFRNRADAGRKLLQRLQTYQFLNPIILALPRGGVVIGHVIAKGLDVPMDVLVVRKIGSPANKELGLGAIAEGGVTVLDESLVELIGASEKIIKNLAVEEHGELERRVQAYRGNRPFPQLSQRTVILVDDGAATGVSALAAIKSVLQHKPYRVVFAVPVSEPETAEVLTMQVDEFVSAARPESLASIGDFYDDFSQVSDEVVIRLLNDVRRERYLRPS
jgi:putative phosphoribosyl transferase